MEEESWYHAMQRKYREHVQEYDNDPDPDYFKLTWEEFFCQQKIDEDEFGPDNTPVSIMRDSLDLPWHEKECRKEWRLRAHRFHEVQKFKKLREARSESKSDDCRRWNGVRGCKRDTQEIGKPAILVEVSGRGEESLPRKRLILKRVWLDYTWTLSVSYGRFEANVVLDYRLK